MSESRPIEVSTQLPTTLPVTTSTNSTCWDRGGQEGVALGAILLTAAVERLLWLLLTSLFWAEKEAKYLSRS